MAIEFLPDQPIVFDPDVQDCKNSDPVTCAQLLHMDDKMCVQFKQTPCGPEQLCALEDDNTELTAPAFDAGGDAWDLGTNWSYDGDKVVFNGVVLVTHTQQLRQTLSQPIAIANHYKTVVIADIVSGAAAVYVAGSRVGLITESGSFTFYHSARLPIDDIWIEPDADQVGLSMEFTIELFDTEITYDCYDWSGNYVGYDAETLVNNPDFSGSAAGWILTSGFAYGSFNIVHTPGTVDTLSQRVPTTNHFGYRVQVQVAGRTSGSLTVSYGNRVIGIITTNALINYEVELSQNTGTFDSNAIFLTASSSFDGQIQSVTICDPLILWRINDTGGLCKMRSELYPIRESTDVCAIGLYYRVKFTITGRTLGSIRAYVADYPTTIIDAGLPATSNGEFTQYITNSSLSGDYPIAFVEDAAFDGCISAMSLKRVDNSIEMVIVDRFNVVVAGTYTPTAAVMPVELYQDYITWCFTPQDLFLDDVPSNIVSACYRVGIYSPCNSVTEFSEPFYISTVDVPCTTTVKATNAGEAFGFWWGGIFEMFQRLKTLRILPTTKFKGDEYTDSKGENFKPYLEKDKLQVLWVDYIDEAAYDALATQIGSANFTINDVAYTVPLQDIEPIWSRNMGKNKAQLKVDIKKKISKTFNRL